jgi:putative drug exporter of the RND superfamily
MVAGMALPPAPLGAIPSDARTGPGGQSPRPPAPSPGPRSGEGALGRLGRAAATHRRRVVAVWAVLTVALGILAPRVEHALSGAGWEATGSASVQARDVVDREFGGLSSSALQVVVHDPRRTVEDPAFRATVRDVTAVLQADRRIGSVVAPQPGVTVSQDGRTAVVQAAAAAAPDDMVRAADDLKTELRGTDGVQVALTGASGMWSDFNEANRDAMVRSELLSWPVTLAILVVAFGSLVAAGLPLLLTILGLVASAGSLFLVAQVLDVSIWAMNFALMFALALGVDYALFLVMRFRAARQATDDPVEAVAETMDTAGKAVAFSGLTVLISLSAVLLVPSPAFRSMAGGIMVSVLFVLLATLTLLPAVLAWLGGRVDRLALPGADPGRTRSARFAAWGERLWRRPVAAGLGAVAALVLLAVPVLGLQTGMPSIAVVPEEEGSRVGYGLVQEAFGPGAPGALQVVAASESAERAAGVAAADPGIARVLPPRPSADGDLALVQAIPTVDPSDPAISGTVDRLRETLPAGSMVGGAVAENVDLEQALGARTALVITVVVVLGFLLLLVALQAPLVAAVGALTNLLAVGAAFGAAKLIFQDGHGAGLLGFESQGFLDAWAPVFFFAMVFAISMDYTLFLLSSAKEHWDRTGDPRQAMVEGLASSGRVVLAAAGVMVAVFLTFALSGPLPPKEMGVILGIAVLLDALLVRLLLLPVLLRAMGRRAWWVPRLLARILPTVRFGH